MPTAARHARRALPPAVWSLFVVLAVCVAAQTPATGRPLVLVATRADTINPITAGFFVRAIEHAEQRHAACLVVLLDTPGGLVDSTRAIPNGAGESRRARSCVIPRMMREL